MKPENSLPKVRIQSVFGKSVRNICIVFFLLIYLNSMHAQDSLSFFSKPKEYSPLRGNAMAITSFSLYAGSMTFLYHTWYKGYDFGKFHSFNDNAEWNQMDKFGHLFNSYNICTWASQLAVWTGASQKGVAYTSTVSSLICMTSIEFFDGFSNDWGFSFGDMAFNLAGAGFYFAQEMVWKEQRMHLKYSFYPSTYYQYRPDLLGKNFSQQLLKDYNAQTFWLTINLSDFVSENSKIPKWLGLAVGYGADGLIGGMGNPKYDINGNAIPYFERSRRFFLAPEIELTKIKTKSMVLKFLFRNFGILKFPLPTLEYRTNGKWYGHLLYF